MISQFIRRKVHCSLLSPSNAITQFIRRKRVPLERPSLPYHRLDTTRRSSDKSMMAPDIISEHLRHLERIGSVDRGDEMNHLGETIYHYKDGIES